MRSGTPLWGAYLGVQLLAAALGARVYAGPRPELGVLPVELTDEAADDPVFGGLPRRLLTLQWHGDTFDLPEGAVRLARFPAYENQAFRYGNAAYGVQLHVEVTADVARGWAKGTVIPRLRRRRARPGRVRRADGAGDRCVGRGARDRPPAVRALARRRRPGARRALRRPSDLLTLLNGV